MTAPAWLVPVLGLGAVAGGLAVYASAFGRLKLRRKIKDTPTARLRSAAAGQVELKGLALAPLKALSAPFSASACVWWRATVERLQRDSKGNSHWQTVHSEQSSAPFALHDAEAQVAVDPDGAEIDAPMLFDQRRSGFDLAGSVLSAGFGSFGFGGDYRYREWRLDLERPLYVLGVLRGSSAGPCVARGRLGEPFLISHHDEAAILRRLGFSVALRWLGGSAMVLLGAWMLLVLRHRL